MLVYFCVDALDETTVTKQQFTTALWAAMPTAIPVVRAAKPGVPRQPAIHSKQVWINLSCGENCLWEYGSKSGPAYKFAPPVFEVDGKQIAAQVRDFVQVKPPVVLDNQATEYLFEGACRGHASTSRLSGADQ